MSNPRRTLLTILLAAATVVPAPVTGGTAADDSHDARAARAERAGLRVLRSRRLTLVTDRPARDGDGIEALPALFDQAFTGWCGHYGIAPEDVSDWRAFGCLVVDRDRFREAGLLPASIPNFANGFCAADTFWVQDQSNPAYRRHLLLHEGVHAFTLTVRNLATPAWYNEGIAEYLATHRIDDTAEGPRLTLTPMPARPADVEQLGRIEELHALRAAGRMPPLAEVLETAAGDRRSIRDYATNWALVAMLAKHPAYAEAFAGIERGPLGPDFTARVASMPGFDATKAARDFAAFGDDIDYRYDFGRSAIDWSAGPPLMTPRTVEVHAGRGWQNTGVSLARGGGCEARARGRCTLGRIGDTTIETEADGISLDWYRGRPLGRLLIAQWVASPSDVGQPQFVVIGEGRSATMRAATDGPVFVKLNEPPGDLADDQGALEIEISPAD